ncbi:MAG: hypothetical protein AB8F95_10400, partial [Bacteroidia bacterium]
MLRKAIILFLLSQFSIITFGQTDDASLPEKIVITDVSFDRYIGRFEYRYELVLDGSQYRLYRTNLFETDYRKKKKRAKKKFLDNIATPKITELITELANPKDSFGIEDLGYTYDW